MSAETDTRVPNLSYPDDAYLLAIGEAVFNFGLIEMSVVHYLDYHEPGFAAKSYDMTAVPIMEKFASFAKARADLNTLSSALIKLAVLRNTLLHSRPVGEPGKVPRIGYAGKEGAHEFKLADIQQFSRSCAAACQFFDQWALAVSQDGAMPFDEAAFMANILPMIERWSKRLKKKIETDDDH
jgi:hypothetical protein